MDIGWMDRRLELQNFAVQTDPSGQAKKTFATAATCWAKLDVNSGRNKYENDQEVSVNEVSFIIRFRTDIKADWQVVMEGQEYKVLSVEETRVKHDFSRRRFLRIKAEIKY